MKRYNLKRYHMENSLDWKTPPTLRKYFNSSERQEAKKEIHEVQELLIEDKEIKIRDREDLYRALNRKYNQVRFDFARTLHKFGITLHPGGDRTNFRNSYKYSDFNEEWDYSDMTEEEILEMLALTTKQDYVIDINAVIKSAKYTWWDEYY